MFRSHTTREKNEMDSKAIKAFLVEYDEDERYRIFIKHDNKLIDSGDVTLTS